MRQFVFKTPKRFQTKVNHLQKLISKKNPICLISNFTGRKLRFDIIIKHANLDKEAKWGNKNEIFIDFKNRPRYLWLSICHELAHIILRNPPWYKDSKIKIIIKKHKDYRTPNYKYDFTYAIEQTLAILIQATCEEELEIRSLKWNDWRSTFEHMDVLDFGKKFWKGWLRYLKNKSKYKNIDKWLLEELIKFSP